MIIDSTYSKLYWYKISVKPKQSLDPIKVLIWKDMRFDIRTKYDWYFKYRASLLQVQHPKMFIQVDFGSDEASTKTRTYTLKNLIINRKAQVTKWQNNIEQFKRNWNSLFPLNEDQSYKAALAKLEQKQFELKELENEYNTLIK